MINNLETVLRHRFRLLRLLDNKITSSDCEIECDLQLIPQRDIEEIHLRLSAMKLWLDDFVDGSIAHEYDRNTDEDTSWMGMLENSTIMTPAAPADHVMLTLIHAKLSTIGGDVVIVDRTHFFSDTGHGFSNKLSGSADEWLPTIGEWIGPRHYHQQPWWYRADASAIDLVPDETDDVSKPVDFGGDLVDMLRANSEQPPVPQTEKKPAEIIKPTFKPKLINNDDD